MTQKLIIHVTNNFGALKNILKTSSLKLSYCGEIFNMGNEKISSAAHPMVCFSEYGLNELKEQNITYGKYGLALTKEWARKNKLNPVLYVESTSQAAKGLSTLLRARQGKLPSVELPDALRLPIMQLKCFTKNVRGYNSFFEEENYDFSRENEWRYVPYPKEIEGNFISQHLSKYKKAPEKYNKRIEKYSLGFSAKDIKAIFVSSKVEIENISKTLKIDKDIVRESNWTVPVNI